MRILWSGPAFMLSWALLVKFALVDGGYDVLKVNCRKDIISNKKLLPNFPANFFANHFLILWWLYYEAKRTFFLLCTYRRNLWIMGRPASSTNLHGTTFPGRTVQSVILADKRTILCTNHLLNNVSYNIIHSIVVLW